MNQEHHYHQDADGPSIIPANHPIDTLNMKEALSGSPRTRRFSQSDRETIKHVLRRVTQLEARLTWKALQKVCATACNREVWYGGDADGFRSWVLRNFPDWSMPK